MAQRTDALTGYLTENLQRLTADTVKSDIAVSSSVQDVQIWSVEQNGSENDFAVVFTVAQTISDGKKKDTVSSVYKTAVHKDENGDMVITQAPTITGKLQNLHIRQKPQNPTERFLRLRAKILRIS